MSRLDNTTVPTILRSPQPESAARSEDPQRKISDGDRLLADLERELEQREREAAILEERLEAIVQRGMTPEVALEAGEQRWRDYSDRRDELDRVVGRLTEIPYEMSRTPASSLRGVMVKIRQMETSLAVGAAESDVPLLASVSSDLARLGGESLKSEAAAGSRK